MGYGSNNQTPIQVATSNKLANKKELLTSDSPSNREVLGKKHIRPIMTFVDDDGDYRTYPKWKTILIEKQVPVTCCLITDYVSSNASFLTWTQVAELKALGMEFVSHGAADVHFTALTEDDLRENLIRSQKALSEHDCTPNIVVYPGGYSNALVRRVCRDYFRVGFNIPPGSGTDLNYPPIATFGIRRSSLAGNYNNTLEHYKAKIDECVATNGWLVWMSHASFPSFDDVQIGYIKELIDYARGLGVEILSTNEALDVFGNVLDVGDYTGHISDPAYEYTILDAEGIIHSKSNNGVIIDNSSNVIYSTPADYFKRDKITQSSVSYDRRTGFPESQGGLLVTHKGIHDTYVQQVYYPSTTGVFKRHWDNSGSKWSEWLRVSAAIGAATRPITAYVGMMHFETGTSKPIWCKTKGVNEETTLTITAGATSSGNISVTLNNNTTNIAVEIGDTPEIIGNKIRGTSVIGWNPTGDADSAVVVFVKLTPGVNGTPAFNGGLTGVTGTIEKTVFGSSNVWVDATGATV